MANEAKRRGAKTSPPRPRIGGALDDVNDAFHGTYDDARSTAELEAPVFVLLADSLVVCRGAERTERVFAPPEFHVIKSAAHAPIAVFAALTQGVDRSLDGRARQALSVIRDAASRGASSRALSEDVGRDVAEALQSSSMFIEHVLDEGRASRAALDAFTSRTGPLLLRLTEHATRMQLAALHAAVEAALATLSADERHALQVVVVGDHQARVRSLGMQYFQKRFGEAPGAETRVTYGEGIDDADQAVALVGTRRLDRAIATAFFGDAKRLQRDVLGDAAQSLLRSSTMDRLDDKG
jgi:hypothetical protein